MTEAQTQEDVSIRWDMGLNQKRIAIFRMNRDETEMRLVIGEELKLRLDQSGMIVYKKPWDGEGYVVRSIDNEIYVEMKNNNVPIEITEGCVFPRGNKPFSHHRTSDTS